MARQVNPKRAEAKALFLKKKGKITPKEIAEKLGVSAKAVREWKCRDKWETQIPKRGAPKGNKNAVGNSGGAPKGNRNAETHGAYSTPRMEAWTQEERERLEGVLVEFDSLAGEQLKRLLAKQYDLESKISQLKDGTEENEDTEERLYLDRVMTMMMPEGGEMKYRSESSAFSRRMTLEAELNRVQGRIQKLMDSIRAREDAQQRITFEREKFEFAKQKALGEFTVDDNGNLDLSKKESEHDEIIE